MINRSLAAASLCALFAMPAAAQDPADRSFLAGVRSIEMVMTRAGEECTASQYGVGDRYNGRPTASGEIFDTYRTVPHPTAAHRDLAFGTLVTVTHLGTGRSVKVRINDRGPFIAGRCIDLSRAAATAIGMGGTARVRVE